MSDRHKTLVVILIQEQTEEQLDHTMHAIGCIRGVSEVKLGPALTPEDYIAQSAARRDLTFRIQHILQEFR